MSWLIQVAAVYLTIGLVVGLAMAIANDYSLSSVHARVSLLGWATMALAGIVYILMPGCSRDRLAKVHFWGHNIGLPVMMISLTLYSRGITAAEKALAVSSTLVVISLVVFTVNLMRHGRLDRPQ